MATMQDFETIEVIKKERRHAKDDGGDIPSALSGGKEYYRRAISTLMLSGAWTAWAMAITAVLAAIISLSGIGSSFGGGGDSYQIPSLILTIILATVPVVLGHKVHRLESTPAAVLVFLIITLIFNLIFAAGILPLVSSIINIVALARWSTYRDWFYNIDVERSR